MYFFIHLNNRVNAESRKMEEAKKREHAEALEKVDQLCKEFGFTAGMLRGVLAKDRNRCPKT